MRVLVRSHSGRKGSDPSQHKRTVGELGEASRRGHRASPRRSSLAGPTGRKSWVVLVDGHRSARRPPPWPPAQLKTLLR